MTYEDLAEIAKDLSQTYYGLWFAYKTVREGVITYELAGYEEVRHPSPKDKFFKKEMSEREFVYKSKAELMRLITKVSTAGPIIKNLFNKI